MFFFLPQTWLMNQVVDQPAHCYCIPYGFQRVQMQNNWEVLSWTTKMKRKKVISPQQTLAATMSLTIAVALSGDTVATDRKCPIADLKAAADWTSFRDRFKKGPDGMSGLFI